MAHSLGHRLWDWKYVYLLSPKKQWQRGWCNSTCLAAESNTHAKCFTDAIQAHGPGFDLHWMSIIQIVPLLFEFQVKNSFKVCWDGGKVLTTRCILMTISMVKIRQNGMNSFKVIKSARCSDNKLHLNRYYWISFLCTEINLQQKCLQVITNDFLFEFCTGE